MKKIFLSIIITITATACSNMQVRQSLDDIESYIMERPDSALTVLDTMNRQSLTTKRLKAHHALLHAMALDKNYIDVTDDSLARVALTYFSKHGPQKYEARSLYYLALSYYYAGDYSKAILEFTKAEKVAETSDSLYWGFTKVLQSYVFADTYNFSEGLNCLTEAIDIYRKINAEYYQSVAELRLSQTLLNEGYYKEGEELLKKLINSSDNDIKIRMTAITSYAFIKVAYENPDYSKAYEYYTKILEEHDGQYMSVKDYWAYSFAMIKIGRGQEAISHITRLSQIDSSSTADYWQYRISKELGNTQEALSLLEKSSSKNNVEVTNALKQSLAFTQKEYYESKYREASLLIKIKNQTIFIVLFCSILIILVATSILQRYIAKSKSDKEQMLEYIEEIKRQLDQSKSEEYPLLKKRFISLYKSRFEAIGQLCEQYLQNKERDDIESVMYRKMLLMIEDIRNDAVRRVKFETLLDTELENIMTRFRNEMPKCKESDVTLFSYLVVGFDATTISRLMNLSLNNVYAHKRRLRIKIEEKKPEHMQQFLEMIA